MYPQENGKPVAEIQVNLAREQNDFAADVNGLGKKKHCFSVTREQAHLILCHLI